MTALKKKNHTAMESASGGMAFWDLWQLDLTVNINKYYGYDTI